jgi:hypothetical protein
MSGSTINGAGNFGCANSSYYTWIYTSILDDILPRYVVTMRLKNIRGAGNYGTVKILCARPEIDDTVTLVNVGGSFNYSNPSPYVVGSKLRFNLTFKRA